jgi:hypothetical protein
MCCDYPQDHITPLNECWYECFNYVDMSTDKDSLQEVLENHVVVVIQDLINAMKSKKLSIQLYLETIDFENKKMLQEIKNLNPWSSIVPLHSKKICKFQRPRI